MSVGLHRLWKRRMITEITSSDGIKVLDVAGGTGDIAFRILHKVENAGHSAEITVYDINQEMLDEGKARAIDRNILGSISWQHGNAEKLPFKDSTFDYYTIAFGIRNVTDINKVLTEAKRVLRPGGKFICLEFSQVDNSLLSSIYDIYSFQIIPRVGQIITGNKAAYQYLVESIRKFPTKDEFAKIIEYAGLTKVKYTALSNGVVAIHTGWRI